MVLPHCCTFVLCCFETWGLYWGLSVEESCPGDDLCHMPGKVQLFSFKSRKGKIEIDWVDSIWEIFQTCKIYLWVDGPAPAYSAKSRSTNPIWNSEIESIHQHLILTFKSAAFNPSLKDESTFLKFLPPFSSFLMETLHLQESRTPVEEFAAI